MARTDSSTTTSSDLPPAPVPGDGDGSSTPDTSAQAGTVEQNPTGSALEVLAAAGDEASRRALGQPTGSEQLAADRTSTGLTVGKASPRTILAGLDGRLVDESELSADSGFRGTVLVAEGDVVTASIADAVYAAQALSA